MQPGCWHGPSGAVGQQLPGDHEFVRCHHRGPTADTAAGSRGGEALTGAFDDEVGLELVEAGTWNSSR